MAIWEYKVISSGKGGFANPQMLENFLNELGTDEWEIIDYRPAPDNPLAFTGLARRGSQRDWTFEVEAAVQAREDEKRKREDERRQEEERIEKAHREAEAERAVATAVKEVDGADDGLRPLRDTDRDDDPEALADEADGLTDWDDLDLEDDLPTLLDAIKPHLRRNHRGIGEAAAIDYLAKRWDQEPGDVIGALEECGFVIPETEDDLPGYFEFEGDLFWLNCNHRGQLFLNVREKPRPRFKATKLKKLAPDDPAAEELRTEHEGERSRQQQQADGKAARAAEPLPAGLALLDLLKPRMRRSRRSSGLAGTIYFLARAIGHSEADLLEALKAIDLTLPPEAGAKPTFVEFGNELYWLQQDYRGGIWINVRDKDKAGNSASSPDETSADDTATEEQPEITFSPGPNAVPALRLLLQPKSRGTGVSAEISTLAESLHKPAVEILEVLVKAGLNVPEDADDKPTFLELGDEILWLNRNAKDDSLWLNAKVKPKRKRAVKKTTTRKTTKKPVVKKTTKAVSAKEAVDKG